MSTYDTIMAQQIKQRMDRASQAPPLNAPSLYPTQQHPLTTPPQLNVQQAATGGVQHQPKPQSQTAQQQPQMSYADMFVQLNPYRQPTPEELEAERKRYKRNAVFAAISDGLSALSNLYFTTKGAPNAYTGGSTLTGKMYERQKQLMQERQANQEKWLNGYLRAMEMDRNAANQERNWRHQLQREALTDQRYDEQQAENARRWNQQWENTLKQQAQNQANADRNFEASERQRQASNALAWANHNLNKEYKTEQNRIKELTAKVKNAGEETLSDGENNTVKINKLVWNGSMDGVYEKILLNEWQNSRSSSLPFENFRKTKDKLYNTPQKKAGYVRGNWYKYDETKKIMYNLSQIDPMEVASRIDAESTDDNFGGTVVGNANPQANDSGQIDLRTFLRK